MIGDGVMLHPPYPRVAPRHGRTVGRPWVLDADGRVQPRSACPSRRCRSASTRARDAARRPGRSRRVDRDHVTIAVALELERAFGGWVDPQSL